MLAEAVGPWTERSVGPRFCVNVFGRRRAGVTSPNIQREVWRGQICERDPFGAMLAGGYGS